MGCLLPPTLQPLVSDDSEGLREGHAEVASPLGVIVPEIIHYHQEQMLVVLQEEGTHDEWSFSASSESVCFSELP